jgi:hypothetical protein
MKFSVKGLKTSTRRSVIAQKAKETLDIRPRPEQLKEVRPAREAPRVSRSAFKL